MVQRRKVEIFSAGCPICNDVIQMIRELACDSCDVDVLDLNEESVAERAADLGIRSVPAVAVNGSLAACCEGQGVDKGALRAAGIGQPINKE